MLIPLSVLFVSVHGRKPVQVHIVRPQALLRPAVSYGVHYVGNKRINAHRPKIIEQNIFSKLQKIHLIDVRHKYFKIIKNVHSKNHYKCDGCTYNGF